MKYDDISEAMRRFLGGFEAFRKMGFKADDIFCLVQPSARAHGAVSCFTYLKAQGKEFSLECGLVEDEEAFSEEYTRVSTALNAHEIPQEDLDRIWLESEPFQRLADFSAAVIAKGFIPPRIAS